MAEYIDRAVVKKHLDECAADDTILCDYRDACIALSVYVEMLPAADVQPVKRGKWEEHHAIYIKQFDICLVRAKCSCCGRNSDKIDDYCQYLDLEYCSHCGADMRGNKHE